jgi:hypothetical protein
MSCKNKKLQNHYLQQKILVFFDSFAEAVQMDRMIDVTVEVVGHQAVDRKIEANAMHVLPNEQLLEVDPRLSLAGQRVQCLAVQIVVSAMQTIIKIFKDLVESHSFTHQQQQQNHLH